MAMKFESAVVNGLIEDFATVVCFVVDCLFFGLVWSVWSVIGCICVAFVVLSITFGKL